MKYWIAVPFISAVLLTGCSDAPPPTKVPRTVLVRTVDAAGGIRTNEVYAGEVKARIETDLAFRVGGKITVRYVDTGAVVTRGQPLARLDPQDAQLAAGAAAAQVAVVQSDVVLAQAEYERAQALRARNFISESALDVRHSALQAAQARLHQAEAQNKTASLQADYTQLLSDSDGVVVSVIAEVGQVVAAGQPVMKVARPGEREVLIHVPETRVGNVKPGMAAQVVVWSHDDRPYAAVVREVAPVADSATRTYAVRVSVPEADEVLKLGATANVIFEREAEGQALLPLPAIGRAGERAVVWLVDDNQIVRRQFVDIATFREDGALVRSGLPERARVVVTGIQKLIEGEEVRVVDEQSPVVMDARR